MTRDEIRAYVRANPIPRPPLSPALRIRLAVLLRPDLPVGIMRQRAVRDAA